MKKDSRYSIKVSLKDKASQIYNGEEPNLNGEKGFGKIKDNQNNIILNVFLNDNSSKSSMPQAPKAYNDDYDPDNYDPCIIGDQLDEYVNASVVPENDNYYQYYVKTAYNSNKLVNFDAFISIKNGKISIHNVSASTNITSVKNAFSEAKKVKKLYYATRKAVRVFFGSDEFKNRKSNANKNKQLIKQLKAQHSKKERAYHKKLSELE